MELFSIRCETCGTSLKVRSTEAIGQILSCPKCESMVQVAPPPGWQPPAEPEQPALEAAAPQPAPAEPPSPAPAAPTEMAASAGEPETYQAPFGFEPPPPADWKKRAAIGMLAVAAVLFGVMGWLWANRGDQPVAQNPPPAVEPTPAKTEPSDDPGTDPAPTEDPDPAVTPEQSPDSLPPPPTPTPRTKVEIDPVTGRPAAPASPRKKQEPTKVENPPAKVPQPAPPKVQPKPPVPNPNPPPKKVDPPADPPALTNPLLPTVEAPPQPDPEAVRVRKDVDDRLNDAIASIDIRNKPLAAVIDEISQLSTLVISLDLDSLSAVGVTPEDKVSVSLSNTTVGQLLERLLDQVGLVYVVESGQVRVISQRSQAQQQRIARYNVADLAPDEASAAELVRLIQALVAPGTWQLPADAPQDARPPIHLAAGTLTVHRGELVHRQIVHLLDRLRIARGLKVLPAGEADEALATRYDRVADKLSKKLTVNYSEMPLEKVLAELERRTSLVLLIDGLALGQVGLSPDVRATVRTKEAQPVFLILDHLLTPLEIAYRIIDARTLQVTSRQVAADNLEIEFFRVQDLAATPKAAEDLIAQVKQEAYPESWTREKNPPAIEYDAPSQCLIVSHNQYVQVLVEGYLNTLRRPVEQAPPQEAGKAPPARQ